VDLVDLVFLTELVEARKQFVDQVNGLARVLIEGSELVELDYVCI